MLKNIKREKWGSKIGFILAAAGSAVGLGNIWKFPYLAGENGGAAFILIYLFSVIVIGLPLIYAEIVIGRTTNRNPVGAFVSLSKNHPFWRLLGFLGVIAGFAILSYYSVVAGWTIGYIIEAIKGTFYSFSSPTDAANHFNTLIGNSYWNVSYFILIMILTMSFVYFGVQKGIELGSKIMMPLLFIILLVLVVRSLTIENSNLGLSFLIKLNWSAVRPETFLLALGQAFFSLSLGMGAMLTYGSYMDKKDSIISSGFSVVTLDISVAILAAFAIFPALFAVGMEPNAGPGLVFHTLPIVFAKMQGGYFFAILFFILLALAALTSTISLLEVITAYFVDEKGWSRKKAVIVFGSFTILLGIPSALSFNVLSNLTINSLNFFDLIDFISSNIFLPIGGLLISIFVGYFWGKEKSIANLKQGSESFFDKFYWFGNIWFFFIRFVSPILIFLVFLRSLGII